MADDADLMGIGEHCSVASCMQIDFLPFKCDACSRTYCLDHRTYTSHSCTSAQGKSSEVIVCPMCAKGIRLQPGQDPHIAFDAHTAQDCDPSNYAKVHKKPRCVVSGCKEKLSTVNRFTCKKCNQKVCLKHRHGDDHKCEAVQGMCLAITPCAWCITSCACQRSPCHICAMSCLLSLCSGWQLLYPAVTCQHKPSCATQPLMLAPLADQFLHVLPCS